MRRSGRGRLGALRGVPTNKSKTGKCPEGRYCRAGCKADLNGKSLDKAKGRNKRMRHYMAFYLAGINYAG